MQYFDDWTDDPSIAPEAGWAEAEARRRDNAARLRADPVLGPAFRAAGDVKSALQNAVDLNFKNDGEYDFTNPFDLPLDQYMMIVVSSMFTLGAAAVIQYHVSKAMNAHRDEYRRQPEKHFARRQKQLDRAIARLPTGKERRLFEDFSREAAFCFRMEKAACENAPDLERCEYNRRLADKLDQISISLPR